MDGSVLTDNEHNKFVSPLVTQIEIKDIRGTILAKISWSHHLIIISTAKTKEEREFYIRLCIKEQLSKRELERQITASLFERIMIGKTKPTSVPGEINFYLEALDRDVKKPNENPSIGILLCKGKDSEVVEYALSRSLSPTMVAEYETQLPDKKLLQQKLHDLIENSNI